LTDVDWLIGEGGGRTCEEESACAIFEESQAGGKALCDICREASAKEAVKEFSKCWDLRRSLAEVFSG
jgi:hypothetical protein